MFRNSEVDLCFLFSCSLNDNPVLHSRVHSSTHSFTYLAIKVELGAYSISATVAGKGQRNKFGPCVSPQTYSPGGRANVGIDKHGITGHVRLIDRALVKHRNSIKIEEHGGETRKMYVKTEKSIL